MFIISPAAKLITTGLKVPVLLATIAEDSTIYFLVIFASQLAFVMSLTIARVSTTVPDSPSGPQSMVSNACIYRNRSGSFQGCKLSNNPWIRPFLPCFIFTISSGNAVCVFYLTRCLFSNCLHRFKAPSDNGWTDNAFAEEDGRWPTRRIVSCGTVHE